MGRLDELRAQLIEHLSALLLIFVVACSGGQPHNAAARTAPAAGKVDSILPAGEALERFLAGAPRTDSLSGGARKGEELIQRFLMALTRRDTAALAGMLVTRGEYGSLYYPTSLYSRKPYELAPDVGWMLNSAASAKGARRLLQRLGGRKLAFGGMSCQKESTEGDNRFSSECEVSYRADDGATEGRQLFMAIMERDGQMKFLSYAGDF